VHCDGLFERPRVDRDIFPTPLVAARALLLTFLNRLNLEKGCDGIPTFHAVGLNDGVCVHKDAVSFFHAAVRSQIEWRL
jgi:hypothetical protein